MKSKFRPVVIGALAVAGFGFIGASFATRARADAWDKMTYVTVDQPIIAGNKVLDPGTYVWKLMDSPADRHIVQIYDRNQRHLETTILAIPDYRLQPTGHTQFSFWETPAGVPKAVRAWFYPGDNYGQELPYPKKLIAQLASARPVPIPTNYNPEPASQPAPQPAPAPVPAAQPAPQPQPQPAPAPAAAQPAPQPAVQQPASLPHTASLSPLAALLGLISLTGAGLLSFATRRA